MNTSLVCEDDVIKKYLLWYTTVEVYIHIPDFFVHNMPMIQVYVYMLTLVCTANDNTMVSSCLLPGGPRIHFTIVYEILIEILSEIKIYFALILILMVQIGHKFAHATTAESWHVGNCNLFG